MSNSKKLSREEMKAVLGGGGHTPCVTTCVDNSGNILGYVTIPNEGCAVANDYCTMYYPSTHSIFCTCSGS